MEVRMSTKVLLDGIVVAHSTMNLIDIEIPGTHTFDLVRPEEDPDTVDTPYQLVVEIAESEVQVEVEAATVQPSSALKL